MSCISYLLIELAHCRALNSSPTKALELEVDNCESNNDTFKWRTKDFTYQPCIFSITPINSFQIILAFLVLVISL